VDLRQIECVLAVSELGSFTRAAESLYVTQSSLSYTVGRIERELGVQLFARSGRRVVLTPAGEAFLPHARESLVAARAAREAACAVGGIVTGQLRVAVTPTLKRFAAETLADLRAKHPEVRISLTVGHPSAVVELVRTASVPIAIVGITALPGQLEGIELFREEIVVVFPPGTERTEPVRVQELEDLPLVVSRQSQTPQLKAQQEWLSSGTARIVAEADNLDGTIELVLAGIGAAVMSIDGAAAAVERGAVVASLDPPSFYPVGLVYRSGRLSPVEREYHALVLERARALHR